MTHRTVDLNCDLGELPGPDGRALDAALLTVVTSANVACGGHAGDAATMRRTCEEAAARGVVVGAHPSYVDREHFGRRALDVAPDVLRRQVLDQLGALADAAAAAGTRVAYVKPHGALYHRVARDEEQAEALLSAVREHLGATAHGGASGTAGTAGTTAGTAPGGPPAFPVVGPPGSRVLALAARAGLRPVAEAFVDRAYTADGGLVPRDRPGAVVQDDDAVARQAVGLAREGRVATPEGGVVAVRAETLCLHGDTPGAVGLARTVRDALLAAGVTPAPFAG